MGLIMASLLTSLPGWKLAVIVDQTDQPTSTEDGNPFVKGLDEGTRKIELLVLAATATSFRGASVECNGGRAERNSSSWRVE